MKASPMEFAGALVNPFVFPRMWPNIPLWQYRSPARSPDTALVGLAAVADGCKIDLVDAAVSGLSFEEFVEGADRYRFVGIRAVSSHTALYVHTLAAAVKARSPDTLVVLGGHHATVHHRRWFEFAGDCVDVVVRSEGEQTFRELVDAVRCGRSFEGIRGITWRGSGGIIRMEEDRPLLEDLDSLPIPRFDLWEWSKYDGPLPGGGGMGALEFSRGCANRCGFCVSGPMWGYRQRFKSIDRILDELAVQYRLGLRRFFFVDDNFNAVPDFTSNACRRIAAEFPGIVWMAMMSAGPISEHPDLAADMAAAGCRAALVGFESSEHLAYEMLRKGSAAVGRGGAYARAFDALDRAGIGVQGLFIDGWPGETDDDYLAVLRGAGRFCHAKAFQPYEPICLTPNHPGDGDLDVTDFYRLAQLTEPPRPAPRSLRTLHRLSQLKDDLSCLLKYKSDSYASMVVRYKARNMMDALRRPSMKEAFNSTIAWDPRRSRQERLAEFVERSVRTAASIGASCSTAELRR